MTVKLLTEHHLEFLSLKEAVQAPLSLHLSKCHVGNLMARLIFDYTLLSGGLILYIKDLRRKNGFSYNIAVFSNAHQYKINPCKKFLSYMTM